MKNHMVTAAVSTALFLAGTMAHASCADPRNATLQGAVLPMAPLDLHPMLSPSHTERESAAEVIVGTWHVAYTAGGAPFAQAFIQWHSDGTEWENINQPTLGGNICLGSWKQIDHTHVYRNHYGWLFTNGTVSGYFNETETDEVARDGNSYRGINNTIIYDLTGGLIAQVPGTSAATRIAP